MGAKFVMITQLLGDIYAYHPNSGTTRYTNRLALAHPAPPTISDGTLKGMTAVNETSTRGRLYRLVETTPDDEMTTSDNEIAGHIQIDFLVNNSWESTTARPAFYRFPDAMMPNNSISLAVQDNIFFVCYQDGDDYKVQEFHIGEIHTTSEEIRLVRSLIPRTIYTFPADVEVQALTLRRGTFQIVDRNSIIRRFVRDDEGTTLRETEVGNTTPILPFPTIPITGIVLLTDSRYGIVNSAGEIIFYKNVVSSWGVSSATQYQVLADDETGFYSTGVIPRTSPPERDEAAFDTNFRRVPDDGYNGPLGNAIVTHDGITRTFTLQKHAGGTNIIRHRKSQRGRYTRELEIWNIASPTFENIVALSVDVHPTANVPEYYLLLRDNTIQVFRSIGAGPGVRLTPSDSDAEQESAFGGLGTPIGGGQGGTPGFTPAPPSSTSPDTRGLPTPRLPNVPNVLRTVTLNGTFTRAVDMARYDGKFWVLDAGQNRVHAFDDNGAALTTESFALHPANSTASVLCRGIGDEHWYVGNLDPAGFFVYHSQLVEAELTGFTDAVLMENVEFSAVGEVIGYPTPVVTAEVVEGTLPEGMTLDGVSLHGTPTNIPDAGARFKVAYTARNNFAVDTFTDTDTIEYRVFNQKWVPDAAYAFQIPGPSNVDVALDATYLSGASSVEAVGALPSWLTLDTTARTLRGTLPASETTARATIRANGIDGGAEDQEFTFMRSGTMYALDWGSHNPNGTILTINMSTGRRTVLIQAITTTGTDQWGSLAAHDGALWSVNNRTNTLTRIDLNGTITPMGAPIGAGNWQGLVYHKDRFYIMDDNTDRLHSVSAAGGAATHIARIWVSGKNNRRVSGGEFTDQLVSLASFGDNLYIIDNQGPTSVSRLDTALYSVNPQDAVATLVRNLERGVRADNVQSRFHGNWRALTADSTRLYVLENRVNQIYAFDPVTGERTYVADTPENPDPGWEGLAWLPA